MVRMSAECSCSGHTGENRGKQLSSVVPAVHRQTLFSHLWWTIEKEINLTGWGHKNWITKIVFLSRNAPDAPEASNLKLMFQLLCHTAL